MTDFVKILKKSFKKKLYLISNIFRLSANILINIDMVSYVAKPPLEKNLMKKIFDFLRRKEKIGV